MQLTIEQALQQGVTAHKEGKLQDAERIYRAILQSQPAHPDANHNLGVLAVSVNKADAALQLFKTAVEANPKIEQFWLSYIDALIKKQQFVTARQLLEQAKNQCGATDKFNAFNAQLSSINEMDNVIRLNPTQKQLSSLLEYYKNGLVREAEQLAISLTTEFPKHPFAWKALGALLGKSGRNSEAINANLEAVALSPKDAEAHSNLGATLEALGRLDEALFAYAQAINLKPDFTEANVNFSQAIRNVGFSSSAPQLYPILMNILTIENLTRPMDVARSILSLLKHDPLIKDLLVETNFATSSTELTFMIASLNKLPLLHYLMRICPLPDLQLEGIFVTMRKLLLTNLNKIKASPELIYFLSSLCLHCFTNEYVYFESDEEASLVNELEKNVTLIIAQSEQPEAVKILCLASYRPLHKYDWCKNLEALNHLEEVKKRLIKEPLVEKVIAKGIPVLQKISDDVSCKVREQYEENPFPRWVKLAIPIKVKSIAEFCDHVEFHLHSKNIKDTVAPVILIAGCGTGQHAIETASRFSGCQVTAVDLSLASLAYAKRKTAEFGITNLEYLHADILKLDQLEQEFDIIESAGVLHHMDEPMAGWRVLTDILKPGGLMKIGLYSELARRHIIKLRKEIDSLKVGASQTEIRKFRQSLIESQHESLKQLISYSDFYSLSPLRDLIFHVQEHCFDLQQIKDCLDELGLEFCGFEDKDIVSRFTEFHGEGSDSCDLALWHQFEENNPDTFFGMYQLWCQKP